MAFLLMPNQLKVLNQLEPHERLFVAVIKMTIRRKEYSFFENGKCEKLADYLGVDVKMADLIKKRVYRQNS